MVSLASTLSDARYLISNGLPTQAFFSAYPEILRRYVHYVSTNKEDPPVFSVKVAPDGLLTAIGRGNGFLELWDIMQDRRLVRVAAHANSRGATKYLECIEWFPNSRRLATWGGYETKIWSIQAVQQPREASQGRNWREEAPTGELKLSPQRSETGRTHVQQHQTSWFEQFIWKLTKKLKCSFCSQQIELLDADKAMVNPNYKKEIDSNVERLRKTGLTCKSCRKVLCVNCAHQAAVKAAAKEDLKCPHCGESIRHSKRITKHSVVTGKVFE